MKKLPVRCAWVNTDDPLCIAYHDNEWGTPVYDDDKLFEFLVLETFQAGLNWRTILRKRENFRKAFDGFDYKKIAKYDDTKFQSLMQDAGIIRNKLKIEAAINNAGIFMQIQKEFGSFSRYIWQFTKGKPIVNHWKKHSDIPANSPLSDKLSQDMKKKGFKFVGTTIMYAYMQATGMVNDHTTDCFRHAQLL